NAGGDVIVTAKDTGEGGARIKAKAEDGYSNTADVGINAGGGVRVQADAHFETWADAKVMAEAQNDDEDNIATVIVDAVEDVEVIANHGSAEIFAEAEEGVNNYATVKVITDGDVRVIADSTTGITSGAKIEAEAEDASINTAEIVIDAAGNVLVMATAGENAEAKIEAEASKEDPSRKSTADVEIDAGGDIVVTTEDGGTAKIEAEADVDNTGVSEGLSGDATSVIDIDAGGDVVVGQGGRIEADADVDNFDDEEINEYSSNADADVYITALGEVIVDGRVEAEADVWNWDRREDGEREENFAGDIYSGSSYANVWIDNILGLGVTVGPEGEIVADSELIHWDYPDERYEDNVYSGDAYAGIDIESCGDVIVDGLIKSVANIDLWDANPENDEYSNDTFADVMIKAFGDIIVNSEAEEEPEIVIEQLNGNGGSGGQILAEASNGQENSADITILAVGDVIVNNGSGLLPRQIEGNGGPFLHSPEEIKAVAHDGSTNTAHIGIATRPGDDGDVIVSGQIGARTWVQGEGGSEHTNTSDVEICAARDVIVNGGRAVFEVLEQDTLFLESEEGGQIFAGARGSGPEDPDKIDDLVSFNTANVEIYAGRDVTVHGATTEYVPAEPESIGPQIRLFSSDGVEGGQIIALTRWNNDSENTSYVGISAGRDVTVGGPTTIGEPPVPSVDSIVVSENGDGYGQIIAGAHGDRSVNDALIEICAEGDVVVDGDIEATAGTGANGRLHSANIAIAAGDDIAGSGSVIADADNNADEYDAGITVYITDIAGLLFDGQAYSTTD
ncbi:MAG: hypothetical protein ACYS21_13520, partial [Planctomycetota bacterium]